MFNRVMIQKCSPSVQWLNPSKHLIKVVFPTPLGPRIVIISPFLTCKFISLSISIFPYRATILHRHSHCHNPPRFFNKYAKNGAPTRAVNMDRGTSDSNKHLHPLSMSNKYIAPNKITCRYKFSMICANY